MQDLHIQQLENILNNQKLTSQQKRLEQGKVIIEFWEKFKICDGCDSLVLSSAATCLLCNHYNFEYGKNDIIRQAQKLALQEKTILTAADYED